MFIKISLEGSPKITKVKYEGQTLENMISVAGGKLGIPQPFEMFYTDEEGDQILLVDSYDWGLCLKSHTGGMDDVQTIRLTCRLTKSTKPAKEILQGGFMEGLEYDSLKTSCLSDSILSGTETIIGGHKRVNPAQESPNSPDWSSSVVHLNIVCDHCRVNPIRGIRYKSVIAEDFDLCSKCVDLSEYQFHTFIRVSYCNRSENLNSGPYSPLQFDEVIKFFKPKLKMVSSSEPV